MATKNIPMRFYRFPVKTVGGVRKSTKKVPKMTSLSPAPVEPKIGQPRNICPEVTFSKIHLPYQFRDDRTPGRGSNRGNRRTSFMTTDGVSPPGNVSERGLLYKNPVGSVSGLVRTSVCFNPVGYFPKFPSTTLAI